ncbi:MAG: DNA recombination/repair protein RecA, partial [Eubacterium sp.]|nr:DNA recombination/repair protein RecA [Candidatus Colimonas fimequi]
GKGISRSGDVLDCAVDAKIIEKAGSWYSFQGERIGQGRENVKNFLEENYDVLEKVEGLLLDTIRKDKDEPEAVELPADFDESEFFIDEDGVIIE